MAKKKPEKESEVKGEQTDVELVPQLGAKVEDLQDEEALIEKPKEGLATELGEVKEIEEKKSSYFRLMIQYFLIVSFQQFHSHTLLLHL